MFAPGAPSSKQRTVLLLKMVKETTDSVNEQFSSLAGRRRRVLRGTARALDSLASFSSHGRGTAAEAALLAVAGAAKTPDASENAWGLGVIPPTETTPIRFVTQPRETKSYLRVA